MSDRSPRLAAGATPATPPVRETVSLTIDGRAARAPVGAYLLGVCRQLGIEVPALCDHPVLEPAGACRLCLVEVTHPDWKGWSGLMTSCLYPVAAGLIVSTASLRVLQARRQVLALLAARCPSSAPIQQLAARYGAATTALEPDTEVDDCILCGLCVRVCESYSTAAITTLGRGTAKRVGSFADRAPDECVGCGACAAVCPTGQLRLERTEAGQKLWGRIFPVAVCAVDPAGCSGCGACEEACPFKVARVLLRPGGERLASISPGHCRGCGACVGACPAGAISQAGASFEGLLSRATACAPPPAGVNR